MCVRRRGFDSKQEILNSITCTDVGATVNENSVDNKIPIKGGSTITFLDSLNNQPLDHYDFDTFDPEVCRYGLGEDLHGTSKIISNSNDVIPGTILYTPNTGYYGTDVVSFSSVLPGPGPDAYEASHTNGYPLVPWSHAIGCTCHVHINILPGSPPGCTDTTVNVLENSVNNVIDLSKSITHWSPTGATLSLGGTAFGTNSVIGSGEQVSYTPNKGYIGSDSFKFFVDNYKMGGWGAGSVTCTCHINVIGKPTCTDVSISVPENSTNNNIDLSNNVYYSPGYIQIASPNHGSATGNGQTKITYSPNPGYYGSDSISYTVKSTTGTCTCTINISILPMKPICTKVSFTIGENSQNNKFDLTKAIQGWLPAPSSISISTAPSNGSASPSGEGISYTPNSGYIGTDSLFYTVTNGIGTSSACECDISIIEVKPSCTNFSVIIAANSSNNQIDVSSHIQNLVSTLKIASQPSHGSASIVNTTTISYTPNTKYYGADSFQYTASNAKGSCTCSVLITITVPTPSCASVSFTVKENSYKNPFDLTKYLTYWTLKSSLSISTSPSQGSSTISGETISYTPQTNYYGTDSLQYTVTNETGTSTPCNCNITITPPIATCKNISITIDENSSNNTIDLSNDITPWISGSTVKISKLPAHGSTTVNDESISYTPNQNYYGQDIFYYTVTNQSGTSAACPCTVYISVNPPTCQNLTATMLENTNKSFNLASYITNWTSKSSITLSTKPTNGKTSISGETITYTPQTNYYGNDSLQYTVTNESGTSTPCTCNITITPPIATCTSANETIVENSSNNAFDLSKYIQNWTKNSSSAVVVNPVYGSVSMSGETATYTPNQKYFGQDLFRYTITNETGTSAYCLCNITITPLPQPTCITMTETVDEDSSNNVFDLSTAIKNWSDDSYLTITKGPVNGSASVNNETILYTPKSSFYGSDSISYTVTNDHGTSSTCLCNITISELYPPTCKTASFGAGINSSNNSFDLTSYIKNWTSDSSITITSTAHGTTTAKGEVLTYTPNNGYSGTDTIQYSITNDFGTTSSCTCNVTLISPPTCRDLRPGGSWTATFNENSSGNIIPANPGWWTASSSMTVVSTNYGTTTVSGEQLLYTPNANFSGFDTVTYIVTNEAGSVTCSCNLGIIPTTLNQNINMWASLYKQFSIGNNYPTDWSTSSPTSTTIDLLKYMTWDKNTSISNYNVGNGTAVISRSTVTITPPQLDVNGYMINGVYKTLTQNVGYNILQWGVVFNVTNTFGSTNTTDFLTVNFTVNVNLLLIAPIAKDLTVYMIGGGGENIIRTTVYIYTTPIGDASAYEGIVSPWVPNISTLQIVTGPTNGNVTIGYNTADRGGGYFAYTPNSGYTGNDSFQYTAANPVGTSSTATITIICGSH